MRLAIIILAHKLPKQLALLTAALEHEQIRIYVHIDRRQPLAPFEHALRGHNVTYLRRHKSCWADPRCVDAALEGIRAGVHDGCDYFVLISGQDLPLVSSAELVEHFTLNAGTSYLRYWPIELTSNSRYGGRDRTDFYSVTIAGRRELCVPAGEDTNYMSFKGRTLNTALRLWTLPKGPRRFPPYIKAMRGDTWWSMSDHAVEYLLEFLHARPDYRTYHDHTFAPDEVFFASVLAGSGYEGRIENQSLRYLVPLDGFHPKTFTLDDLPAICRSGQLFARKFDIAADAVVVDRVLAAVAPHIR